MQIVGIGGGLLPTGFFSTPMGASVRAPYWCTRTELMEVLDLARAGAVHVEVEKYSLDEAPEAYRRLHEGTIRGIYVEGENPAMSDPDLAHARAALAKLEHLVVQDIFATETAILAARA